MTSERMSINCDLKNTRLTEAQLKQENHTLSQKRIDLENVISELKSEIHSLTNSNRNQDQQVEILRRENDGYRSENCGLVSEMDTLRI